ncbi:uncharacterized protein CANTADRAFT_92107 [Suhomyces tanzawaensis NRRL Y-17324]|uniref:THO complex subunit HPR1 n=1 Tax=Suhomyces tanzawaensis NRRL Y-17324 TaxID=984487 RepID=A0A1E4SBR2_9ASCO|nr:uncharacterized protein CANTADRAFT_92107 [Suhomyces tanzawaensis NRRL Y-17324]ODV76954.1 hypothetical protein CANTADRAFT_92107 [Suhomyces tanzawaensis NRRL Y-17324]
MVSASKLAQPIEELSQALTSFVDSLPQEGQNYLTHQVDFELFHEKHHIIEDVLTRHGVDYTVQIPETDELAPESVSKAESFNKDVAQRTKDWIISFGFQRAISTQLSQYIASYRPSAADGSNDSNKAAETHFYNHVSILLDFQVYVYINQYQFLKHSYFESVSQVLRLLFEISTYEVEKFWLYLESRETLLTEKVFDRGVVADRISLLEICNRITDKYIYKNSKGNKDLKRKDSFNDSFQFRVRAFLARIFAFEDNTGLNKYFHVSNRASPEFPKVKSPFLEDIIYIQKIFNDPYFYLKKAQYSELNSLVDSIQSVYTYLLSEEVAYQQKHKTDQYLVQKEKQESEKALLKEKYANAQYFPETYWLSSFEHPNKKDLDKARDEDREYLNEQFSNSKVRLQYLLMIFIIANLYLELTPSNKEDFLVSIGAPANIKHLTDESLSESHKNFFLKVKKEMFSTLKTVDNQFAFLIQHMALAEKIWWSWLIYGKDSKTNKSFFVDRLLSQEELVETNNAFQKIFPFKEKRYFNTFVTPQLTRKMRGTRGIEKLQKQEVSTQSYQASLEELNQKIEQESSIEVKKELAEERNALIWKNSKVTRQDNWLELGKIITPEVLVQGMEEPKEDPKEKSKEDNKEESSEDNKDAKEQDGIEIEERESTGGAEGESTDPTEEKPREANGEVVADGVNDMEIDVTAKDILVDKPGTPEDKLDPSRTTTPEVNDSVEKPETENSVPEHRGSKRPRSDSEEPPVSAKRTHV